MSTGATQRDDDLVAGRYRLGALLGAGAMAEVFAADDLTLERPVALKMLRPQMAAREDVRARFQIEARAAAALSHPNAVAVYDSGEHEGRPFLVMERLSATTLRHRIVAGAVDAEWLRRILVDVLGALGAAHEAGIVHRDVKPANIVIADDGTAKIADFGIAKSLDPGADSTFANDLTMTGQLIGTPAYVAPERLEGRSATPQSDIYAVGVVAYQALAGVKPFAGETPIAVARAVAEGRYRPLSELRPDLDPDLVAVVERAMAHDPARRFASAEELAAAFAAPGAALAEAPTVEVDDDRTVVGDHTSQFTLPPAGTPGWRREEEGPSRTVLVGAVAALGLLLVVFGVLRAASGEPGATDAAAVGPAAEAEVLSAEEALAGELRALADALDPEAHGPRAAELAEGLREVADPLEAGDDASGPATALAIKVSAWSQVGGLDRPMAGTALGLLEQVPGARVPQATSAPQLPQPSSGDDGEGRRGGDEGRGGDNEGRDKGKDKDD